MIDLIVWWTVLALFGLAFTPVAAQVFPTSFQDGGRAFAKPLALVFLTYASWLLTSAGIPHAISLGIGAVALAAIWLVARRRSSRDSRAGWLDEEGSFLASRCFFAALR